MGQPAEVEEWLRERTPQQREQAEWLTKRVRAADAAIAQAIKWRRLTFTLGGDWHHWLCAIGVTKRGVGLVLHKGSLLDDPAQLLEGEGRYVRQIPYERAAGHPDAVTSLVREAIRHQTEMLDD